MPSDTEASSRYSMVPSPVRCGAGRPGAGGVECLRRADVLRVNQLDELLESEREEEEEEDVRNAAHHIGIAGADEPHGAARRVAERRADEAEAERTKAP